MFCFLDLQSIAASAAIGSANKSQSAWIFLFFPLFLLLSPLLEFFLEAASSKPINKS